ncbi:hypothetical protein GQ44DRAFT_782730 [Phaeosphaeriaceae sp. PMI808]|nr:hypothetical protein GQ44DRAFT_782730 [Phaeosphaeriaceae sp. PMI808]
MVVASQSRIIKSNPIGERLDGFRNRHALNPLDDDNQEVDNEGNIIPAPISTSASLLSYPFLRLPPEIQYIIYRILLRSERHVRMIPPPQDEYHTAYPNNLYPSILGTCRLIYQEAHYVLYGENLFLAHRINENNHNAALIRRAKYHIGLHKREDGEDEARKLAELLGFQRELRFIKLEFRSDLIEDPSIYNLVCQAIQGHRHLIDIKILSPLVFSEMGWRHS